MSQAYLDRIDFEGKVICETGYSAYFLIVCDLCDFMRHSGIRYLVRGSGCGSCYVWGLGISHKWLDPIQYKLPFERFLNPDRVSMPDLDIDIQDNRRQEVVAYTVAKYGKERVAQIISFGTLGAKVAINDVARALDIPDYQMVAARVTAAIPSGKTTLNESIAASELLREMENNYPEVFRLARRVEGKTRHTSVHAAGVVIAPSDMTDFMPVHFDGNPASRDPGDWSPTTSWDMYDCESRGLLKMDYLGLKTLTVIENTVCWVNYIRQYALNQAPDFDIDSVDRFDDKAWKLLADGKLSGVFQVERSFVRAFAKRMSLMRKDPWQLAVLISIIRPGMMDAGTTEVYLRRAMGQEPPTPIHPLLEKTLRENFGLLIFQEDCMWVSRDLAGFTMAQADNLRRAVSKKKPKDMAKIHPKFIAGCIEHSKITEVEAEKVWQDMATFARYGFNNAHASAYGLVGTYQTAYLKANWPIPYMTALINSEAGVGNKEQGYNAKVAEYVEESRTMGIPVLPPCIKKSGTMCSVDWKNQSIRFGLEMVKRAGSGAVEWIMKHARHANSFKDFILACYSIEQVKVTKKAKGDEPASESLAWKSYTQAGKADIEHLIFAGAFDVFDEDREKLLAMVEPLQDLASKYWEQECKVRNGRGARLRIKPEDVKAEIDAYQIDEHMVAHMGLEARLQKEREVTGCYLSDSPFTPYRQVIAEYTTCTTEDIRRGEGEDGRRFTGGTFAGILRDYREITVKNGKSKGEQMAFLTFCGIDGDLEVVAFANAWAVAMKPVGQDGKIIEKYIERGKAYLVQVSPDRSGKSAILGNMTRLSNTIYAA